MAAVKNIKSTSSPHFWWIIGILVVIIIALISHILSEEILAGSEVMEYISNSSTLLSITLSIFAILYTYTSNYQIQQQFEKINAAAKAIEKSSNQLTVTNQTLDKNIETILSRLERIDDKQELLHKSINEINQHIELPKISNK